MLELHPDDATPLAMELHELEEGFLAYIKITAPVRLMGAGETAFKAQTAIGVIWSDYLINGISEGMATRALLTVTK